MNAEPKCTRAKLVEQPYRFFLWLALAAVMLLALCLIVQVSFPGFTPSPGVQSVFVFGFVGLVCAFLFGFFGFFLALIPPLKPLFRWIVRRSVSLAVCLITLVALAYAVENWRGKRAWENFKEEAKARDESMEWASVIPPPVPDDQNIVMTPLFRELCNEFDPEWRRLHTGPNGVTNEADRLNFKIGREHDPWPKNESANWMIGRRTDLKAWQGYYRNPAPPTADTAMMSPELVARYGVPPSAATTNLSASQGTGEFPVAPQAQTPAADVLLALSRYDTILDELRAVSTRPHGRFPIRYEDGFNALLPHLARMKGITQFLRLRSAAELEAGRIDEAAADLDLSLRLVDLVRQEPLLISQLVRLAQLQLSLSSLWEGLAEHHWSDAQLAGFERRLGGFDFLADCQKAMRGERAFCISTIDYVRRSRNAEVLGITSDEGGTGPDGVERFLAAVTLHLVPGGWFEQNKVSVGRLHLELMLPAVDLTARQIFPPNVSRLTKTLDERLRNRSPYNWFCGMLLPSLNAASTRFAQGQAGVDLARVACALERHRLAHGQYPETLDALVPQFIAKLPHDVINGQPLKYRRTTDDSFVLYSVGWNVKDDGGTVVLNKDNRNISYKEGDWVWQYPST